MSAWRDPRAIPYANIARSKHLKENPDVVALDGEVVEADGPLLEGGAHPGSAGFRRSTRVHPKWRALAWAYYSEGPPYWAERVAYVSTCLQRHGVKGWVAFHLACEVCRTRS